MKKKDTNFLELYIFGQFLNIFQHNKVIRSRWISLTYFPEIYLGFFVSFYFMLKIQS